MWHFLQLSALLHRPHLHKLLHNLLGFLIWIHLNNDLCALCSMFCPYVLIYIHCINLHTIILLVHVLFWLYLCCFVWSWMCTRNRRSKGKTSGRWDLTTLSLCCSSDSVYLIYNLLIYICVIYDGRLLGISLVVDISAWFVVFVLYECTSTLASCILQHTMTLCIYIHITCVYIKFVIT